LGRPRFRARRNLPQALHHRSSAPVASWFLLSLSVEWAMRPSRRAHGGVGSKTRMQGATLAPLPSGHKATIQVGLARSRASSGVPRSRAAAQPRSRAAAKYKVISGVGQAVRTVSLDMLRHPSEETNTKQWRLTKRGLTLPSSGPATAGHTWPSFHSGPSVPCRCGPLM